MFSPWLPHLSDAIYENLICQLQVEGKKSIGMTHQNFDGRVGLESFEGMFPRGLAKIACVVEERHFLKVGNPAYKASDCHELSKHSVGG